MRLTSAERNLLTRATHSEYGRVEFVGITEGRAADTLTAIGLMEDLSEEALDYGRRGSVVVTEHGRRALEVSDR